MVAVPVSWAQAASSYAETAARLSAVIASTREALARSSDAWLSSSSTGSSSSSSSEEPRHHHHHHGPEHPHMHHHAIISTSESNDSGIVINSREQTEEEQPGCSGGALFGLFLIGASAFVAVRAARSMARLSRERAAQRAQGSFMVDASEPMLVLHTVPTGYSKV